MVERDPNEQDGSVLSFRWTMPAPRPWDRTFVCLDPRAALIYLFTDVGQGVGWEVRTHRHPVLLPWWAGLDLPALQARCEELTASILQICRTFETDGVWHSGGSIPLLDQLVARLVATVGEPPDLPFVSVPSARVAKRYLEGGMTLEEAEAEVAAEIAAEQAATEARRAAEEAARHG